MILAQEKLAQMSVDELLSARKELVSQLHDCIATTSGKSIIHLRLGETLCRLDARLAEMGRPQPNPFPKF